MGLVTSRDPWCYNYSFHNLQNNIQKSINFYNDQVKTIDQHRLISNENDLSKFLIHDAKQFSWDRQQKIDVLKSIQYKFSIDSICLGAYRPFTKQNIYFNRSLNNCVYLLPGIFPSKTHENLVICVTGTGVTKDFSAIVTNVIPDIQLLFNSQCFPRYYYEKNLKTDSIKTGNEYLRYDAVTDFIHHECLAQYGSKITKDDIFYYVYGLLHSEDYRLAFATDLKKNLPRIPLVKSADDFEAFVRAGRDLAELHLNYETAKPYDGVTIVGAETGDFTVDKIRFIAKDDKSAIRFNGSISLRGIPLAAYDYVVNGRPAIEWVMDRYQVRIDKKSGLKNDPNDWAKERGQPRYVLDLLLRLITVSLETLKIVKNLPKLTFE
jgi:predicted helicase